jgi:hypothetical protein
MASMPDDTGPEITLGTLHGDLGRLSGDLGKLSGDLGKLSGDLGRLGETVNEVKTDVREVKADVRELKVMVATGFRAFPPDWPSEMLRLLRENNRLTDTRFAQLDATLREQAVETHTILRALATGQGELATGQRELVTGQRELVTELRALVARIDALIRGRRDGRSE